MPWIPLETCDVYGSPDIFLIERPMERETGYRDEVYVCSQGHRVEEVWKPLEEIEIKRS